MKKCGFIVFIILIFLPYFRAEADGGGYIIKVKKDFPTEKYKSELKEIDAARGIYTTNCEDIPVRERKHIETTAQNDRVELIKGFETVSLFNVSNDEMYSKMWHLDTVNIDAAWHLETYGNDVKVAVIDSGCYPHDDLKNNLLTGKNYFDGTEETTDNIGHGTHVSGIIAAEMNDFGVVGLAPRAKIVPLKCFDSENDTDVGILIRAIYDAVDVYDCRIINMSWGLNGDNPFLKEAVSYAYDKGVILVAAVGNSYSNALSYPAAYESVIGVGSVTSTKSKSSFSSYNESVFVVAPGTGILSTYNDGDYKKLNGTSQATPMVSGLAAILLSMDDNKTVKDFKRLLMSASEDLGDVGYDTKFGYGLINAGMFTEEALRGKTVYISPLSEKEEVPGVHYFNLTGEEQDLLCIEAYYDNCGMDYCVCKKVRLLVKESFFCKSDNSKKDARYMAWRNFDFQTPLGNSRTIKNIK